MINPHRVVEILSDLVSERLSLQDRNNSHTRHDEEIAKHLFDHVESILDSTQYSFETEHTIDFDDECNTEQLQKDDDGEEESEGEDDDEDDEEKEDDDGKDEEEEEEDNDDEEYESEQMDIDVEQFQRELMEADDGQHYDLRENFSTL
ncbi:unnamed protein product [Adineta ricciae]|uniref:Uncharacterized protein n=1 Tax=Adineta ricciae TaxID=249248 RepID=A0A815TAL8_ADIRI|nr:unnamed protein product [Adineta ricciae]CAF1687650.1 unnamed protein product [Adineta ricciae]